VSAYASLLTCYLKGNMAKTNQYKHTFHTERRIRKNGKEQCTCTIDDESDWMK
jgi:hypothetical protein